MVRYVSSALMQLSPRGCFALSFVYFLGSTSVVTCHMLIVLRVLKYLYFMSMHNMVPLGLIF